MTEKVQDDVEAALLDAELFLKYKSPRKAAERIQKALKLKPHSVRLREGLREITAGEDPQEAARQCLALVQIYLEREDFDTAQERLLEARALDPRISVTKGLEAIRRARRPDLAATAATVDAAHARPSRGVTFAGDLSVVSVFDAVQVVENARLTGALNVTDGDGSPARVLFNDGHIVGAEAAGRADDAPAALRRVLEQAGGEFDFERTEQAFPVAIQSHSNTNLLLDTLRELDEEKQK